MKIEILAISVVFTVSLLVAMEEIAIVESQSPRNKRSHSYVTASANSVSPSGVDSKSKEAYADGGKRFKSDPSYISSSPSPLFLKECMAQEHQQFSPLPSLSKNSANTSPSSSSIDSKPHIDFKAPDAQSSQALSAEDRVELGSIDLMAAEQLYKRPKIGGIYEANSVHRESTVKRLRELCHEEPTIDAGIEMADAASLLKIMSSSADETIESAGQKAHRGALLLLQAEILRKNGLQLLCESQKLFKDIL